MRFTHVSDINPQPMQLTRRPNM